MVEYGKAPHGDNATFTIILYPDCNIKCLDNLTINIAYAICNAIKKLCGVNLNIKEPNDLILNGKKIGGILTEVNTIGELVETIFIGIGFNVKQTSFQNDIKNKATSLYLNNIKNIEIEEIISAICNELETIIEKF